MAISLPFSVSFVLLILSLFISMATTTQGLNSASDILLSPSPSSLPPTISNDLHENTLFSHTSLLAPILSHLGFTELSLAAPSLFSDSTAAAAWSGPSTTNEGLNSASDILSFSRTISNDLDKKRNLFLAPILSHLGFNDLSSNKTAWSGPFTLFAPSDSSIRTCLDCSVPNMLREHIVPGVYTADYLRNVALGSKLETLSPRRCLTITSGPDGEVFVGGVEITHPDLFNNGLVVIHGIQGFVDPLSPFSCNVERLNSPSLPDRIKTSCFIHPIQIRCFRRSSYIELVTIDEVTIYIKEEGSQFGCSSSMYAQINLNITSSNLMWLMEIITNGSCSAFSVYFGDSSVGNVRDCFQDIPFDLVPKILSNLNIISIVRLHAVTPIIRMLNKDFWTALYLKYFPGDTLPEEVGNIRDLSTFRERVLSLIFKRKTD